MLNHGFNLSKPNYQSNSTRVHMKTSKPRRETPNDDEVEIVTLRYEGHAVRRYPTIAALGTRAFEAGDHPGIPRDIAERLVELGVGFQIVAGAPASVQRD